LDLYLARCFSASAAEIVRGVTAASAQRTPQEGPQWPAAAATLEPSRSAMQKMITGGRVTVNGQRSKASVKLKRNDCIEIYWLPAVDTGLEAEAIHFSVLYEDGDLIAVNKPPGMVVHPAAGNPRGTLVNALLHHCPDLQGIGGARRPGIVHRLDKDTSGVMVVAKNDEVFHHMALQFKERHVTKEYVAFVWGKVAPDRGTIDQPIGRHRRDRKKMSSLFSLAGARSAVTRWQVERRFCLDPSSGPQGWITLLRVTPHTGRTHQIRVHLSDRGYPVVQDKVYGRRTRGGDSRDLLAGMPAPGCSRHALHAEKLFLTHPRTGESLILKAPWFPDMDCLLEFLERETVDPGH